LPDSAFVLLDGVAAIRMNGKYVQYSPAGYMAILKRPSTALLLTPPAVLRVLAAGYQPVVHPSAGGVPGVGRPA
jgi:hypothetical protein